MDITRILEADHRQVEDLFERIEKAEGDDRLPLIEELTTSIQGHMQLEEEVVYPKMAPVTGKETVEEGQTEHELAIRLDGPRFRIQNLRHEPVLVQRLERDGLEPWAIGMVLPPRGTLDLPARDARGGRLILQPVRCLDVLAPRRYATIRHAGQLVERKGLLDELGLESLPLVPAILRPLKSPPPDDQ